MGLGEGWFREGWFKGLGSGCLGFRVFGLRVLRARQGEGQGRVHEYISTSASQLVYNDNIPGIACHNVR